MRRARISGLHLRLRRNRANHARERDDFSDAALVVLGHGTELNDDSAAPVFQHAAELRRRKIFAECARRSGNRSRKSKRCWRRFRRRAFSSRRCSSARDILARKSFRGNSASFSGNLSLKTQNSELFYCRPAGSHDSMTKVILSRAAEVVNQFPFPRAPKNSDTTLFIAGHGTEKMKIRAGPSSGRRN